MTHTGRLCSLRQVAGAAMAGMLLASPVQAAPFADGNSFYSSCQSKNSAFPPRKPPSFCRAPSRQPAAER